MPIYSVQGPDNRVYDIEGPEGASDDQVIGALQAHLATAPPASTGAAPSSISDTALTALQGIVGSGKSMLQGFGAEVAPAESLDELQKWLGTKLTPERQAEIKRQAEQTKAAAKAGNVGQEILTAGKNVAAAPVLTAAQGLGSSILPVAAGLGAAALGASLNAPLALAAAVGIGAKYALGALQGAGEVKGNIYEEVQKELIARDVPEKIAKQQALQSQEYLGKNWKQLGISSLVGGWAAGTGLENNLLKLFGKQTAKEIAEDAARKAASGYGTRVAAAVGKEAIPEAIQGGQGRAATNIALTEAGVPTPTWQGVPGEATTGALAGALAAGPVSAYTERGGPAAAAPTPPRAPTGPRYSAASPPAPVASAPLPDLSTLGYGELTILGETLKKAPQTPEIRAQQQAIQAELKAQNIAYLTKQREDAAAAAATAKVTEAPEVPSTPPTPEMQQVEMRAAMPEGELAPQLDLFGNPLAKAPDEAAPTIGDLIGGVDLTTENMGDAGLTRTPQELEALGQQRLPLRRTPEGKPTTTSEATKTVAPIAPEATKTVAPTVPEPILRPAPTVYTPETAPAVLGPDTFKALGIGPTAVIRTAPIVGMDIADPASAAQIKRDLETYREGRSPGIQANIDRYLARPEFKAIPPEPTNVQPPSAPPTAVNQAVEPGGSQPSVAVPVQPVAATQPAPVQPAATVAPAKPTEAVGLGLAPTGLPASPRVEPKGTTPAALAPTGGMFGALVKPGAPDIVQEEAPAKAPEVAKGPWDISGPSIGRGLQTEEELSALKAAKTTRIKAEQAKRQADALAKRDAAEAAKQAKAEAKQAKATGKKEFPQAKKQAGKVFFGAPKAPPVKSQAAQDAEDTLTAMGRTLPEEDSRSFPERVKEAVADFVPKRKQGESWVKTFADRAADALDASEPLKRAVREEARATMPEGEATDLLIQLSLSQASHAGAVADEALQTGGLKYNEATYKFQTTKSDANLKAINAEYGKMMEAYGLTLPEARYYASTALESKRMEALYKARDKMLADAATLEAAGKKEGAKKLQDKAEALVFHMEPDQVTEGLKLFQTMPEIQKIDDIKQEMRSWIRDLLQKTGVWSEEHGQWMLDNAEWVPFNREFAESETIASGFNKFVKGLQVKAKEQAFKGSLRDVHDVVDNFSNWAAYSIRSAVANQKAQELAQASLEFLPDTEVRRVDTPAKGAADRTVSYLENGTTKYLEFESAAKAGVFRGMESFGRATIPFIGGMLDATNNIFRASITNFPLFPVYQVAMDSISAVFISGLKPKYAFKIPLTAMAEAVRTMTGKSQARETLREYGAVGVSDYNAMTHRTNAEVEAGLRKLSTWGKYQNLMQDINMGADNAVRQAVYLAARDAGLTEAEAIEKAFEIINFRTRLGSAGLTQAARNVVFFNSFLAATRASLKVLSSEGISPGDRTQAKKSLLSNMAWLAGISFLMAAANVGDEDYEKMSRAEQASKLTLPGMHGWGIPMRPDIFTLPKFFAEALFRQYASKYADDPAKLKQNVKDIVLNAVFSGPMPVAQPLKVATELATNYSFFTQRPIVGQGLEKQESYLQAAASTSEASKFIGETSKRLLESAGIESQGISPVKLDYFLRGMLGMYGGAVMLMSNSLVGNKPSESIRDTVAAVPGMGRIAVKEFDSQIKNDFYDLAKQVDTAVATVRKLESLGRIPEAKEYFTKNTKLLQYREAVGDIQRQLGEVRTAISTTSSRTDWDKAKKETEIRRLKIIERQFLQRQEANIKMMRTKALG